MGLVTPFCGRVSSNMASRKRKFDGDVAPASPKVKRAKLKEVETFPTIDDKATFSLSIERCNT